MPGGAQSINGGYDDYLAASEGAAVLTAAKAEKPAADSSNKLDYKRRKELQSDIRKLTTRVSRAEARIAELEAQIAEITAQMQYPDLSADYEKITALGLQLGELQSELDAQTDEWAEASERLEEISGEDV